MGSKPEPAIWSRDTGQRISWYDSFQLHIICMSNINDICCNPTLHDLVLAGWPPCCATSFVVVGRTRPWSIPLAILTKRKVLHGFLFLCIRVVPFSIIMGLRLAALRAAGAPLRKELHGFLFLCIRVVPFSIIMGLRLAALRAAGAPLQKEDAKLANQAKRSINSPGGGGGGTAIYGLYRYVPLWRVWFSRSLL